MKIPTGGKVREPEIRADPVTTFKEFRDRQYSLDERRQVRDESVCALNIFYIQGFSRLYIGNFLTPHIFKRTDP